MILVLRIRIDRARGMEPDSDIDLLVEFQPDTEDG